MSDDLQGHRPVRDASVVVARDADGLVALLSADFARHGGEYLFLPGGRREDGETAEECARRELKEEAGITAGKWSSLGSYAITLDSTARVHLFEAQDLTCGPQELTPTEEGFKLTWWPMSDALDAVSEGRFLLPAGPLALRSPKDQRRVSNSPNPSSRFQQQRPPGRPPPQPRTSNFL